MSDRITARRLIAAREERKRQRRMAAGKELIGGPPPGPLLIGGGRVDAAGKLHEDEPYTVFHKPAGQGMTGTPTGRVSSGKPDWQRLKPPTPAEAQKMLAAYREAYPTPEILGLDFTDAETRILAHDEALERYRK